MIRAIALMKSTIQCSFQWSDHFSWFPGYKWRICLCSNPKCTRHLGWMFEPADNPEINSLQAPSDQGFYALIVGDILSESRKYLHTTTSFVNDPIDNFNHSNNFGIPDVNSLLMTEKYHTEF